MFSTKLYNSKYIKKFLIYNILKKYFDKPKCKKKKTLKNLKLIM